MLPGNEPLPFLVCMSCWNECESHILYTFTIAENFLLTFIQGYLWVYGMVDSLNVRKMRREEKSQAKNLIKLVAPFSYNMLSKLSRISSSKSRNVGVYWELLH